MRQIVLILLSFFWALPTHGKDSQPSDQADLTQLEKTTFDGVNAHRISKGLSLLILDPKISDVCRQHSRDMASGKVPLGHDGFEQRCNDIGIAYTSIAENVAYNENHPQPCKKAIQDWINSRGHRKNLEGDFILTGVGIARDSRGVYYFTQIFIRPAKGYDPQ